MDVKFSAVFWPGQNVPFAAQRVILLSAVLTPGGSAYPGDKSMHAWNSVPLAAFVVPTGHVTATELDEKLPVVAV